MLSVIYADCRKQTNCAECRYAECRGSILRSQKISLSNLSNWVKEDEDEIDLVSTL
jgi:hypothetical protein